MAELSLDEALRGVPAEKLDQVCSSDDLNEISQSLTRWPKVSPWLGLTETDEEEIRTSDLKSERLDVLRRWKEKQKDGATYRSLIEAFCRAQQLDLVDLVIKLLQSSKSMPPPPPHPLPPPQSPPLPQCSALVEYGQYLRDRYKDDIPISAVQWPPLPVRKAFNLAMIHGHQTSAQRGEIQDEFVRLTVTGEADDIIHMKSPVKIEDFFQVDRENQSIYIAQKDRKVILIEGAPGSGKSTLSWDICKRWGEGELFQEYEVVILVQLRDPEVQAAQTLADLLPAQDDAMAESVASQIVKCSGRNVLFILDGWDELPHALQEKPLYQELITPEKKPLLDKSSVIVTSRTISSKELHRLVSSRIEIVGFTPEELRQYFSECLSGDSHAVEALFKKVEENPVVASSCFLPLNAAIIAHFFVLGRQTLPTTVQGIFTSLVLGCLNAYQRERLGLKEDVESLHQLPKSLQEPFNHLCTLSFSGVMEDRVAFASTELEALGISTDVSALGVLQAVPSLVSHKRSVYYTFVHLQIQELLAAYHISSLPGSEQISQFQKLLNQPRFATVLQFYVGDTHLQSERKYLSKVAFLLPTRFIPTGIRDVITNVIRSGDQQHLVSVIGCLFEADSSLCQFVAKQLKRQLVLNSTMLSPLDCLYLGYFLSCVCATTSGMLKMTLSDCFIDDRCCKYLMGGLLKCPIPNATATGQISITLETTEIHEKGAHYIAEVLRNTAIIREVKVFDAKIGELGFKSVVQALITNSSLVELCLEGSEVKITEENGPVLREMLQSNTTLEILDLSFSDQVSNTGAFFIAEGLKQNSSLKELHLYDCSISDEGLISLSRALEVNNSLRKLQLILNDSITISGVSVLTECLKTNRGLIQLWLPYHFQSSDIQEAVNSARKVKGNPLISVWYKI